MYLLSDLQIFFLIFFSPHLHSVCSYLFALCFYFSGCDERAEEVQGRRGQEAWPEQVTGGRTSHHNPFTLACDVHLVLWTCIFFFFLGAECFCPVHMNFHSFVYYVSSQAWIYTAHVHTPHTRVAITHAHAHTHPHPHTHTHDLVASYLYLSEIRNSWVQTGGGGGGGVDYLQFAFPNFWALSLCLSFVTNKTCFFCRFRFSQTLSRR